LGRNRAQGLPPSPGLGVVRDEQRLAAGLVNLGVVAATREWPLHLHPEETPGQCGSQVRLSAGQATAAFLTADSGSHDGEQRETDEDDES
jgi:hypothetical protein